MRSTLQQARSPVLISALLISFHAVLLAFSAAANSATFDEPAHLSAGVAYWRLGDFSIYSLSPPLLRLWAAAPAVLAGAPAPLDPELAKYPLTGRHWVYADDFLAACLPRFAFLLMLARWGMIPISCLAAWVTRTWAAALYGPRAGVAACALYCLNPSILAHGSLITTDLGAAAAMLTAAWLWWRFCGTPTWRRFMAAAIAVLAAHLCKFTAVLLWPMMLGILVPAALANRAAWRRLSAAYIGLGFITLFLLNCLYGFHGAGQSLRSFTFESRFMQTLQRGLPGGLPSPLPSRILLGFDAQKRDTQAAYQGFLFGNAYYGSRLYYYPAALFCKTPLSVSLLAAMAAVSLFFSRRRIGSDEWSLLAAFVILTAGIVSFTDVNIGTRYLLPAFPLAFILIARLWSFKKRPWIRDGLLAVLFIETLLVFPHFLSYINLAYGGPANGWRLLSDSDFDWGQDLPSLHRWMQTHNVPRVTLAYFGIVDPRAYGVDYSPLTRPGGEQYVAISSYYLNGLPSRILTGPGQHEYLRIDFAAELRAVPPVAVAGDTIFIFTRQAVLDARTRWQLGL